MKKIQITKGDYMDFYFFFDELLPEDEPYDMEDEVLERLLACEKEFNECQNLLEKMYEEREVENEK